jgi:DNA repair protein RecO (recombination protein O)
MSERGRVDREPAFVLHAYAYSETSLLVEALSRRHGRLPLLAKGARRGGSSLRGVMLAFQPLVIGWSGRGEVRTLMRCEGRSSLPMLKAERLLCGFYLNELLLRLLPREDPHEALFDRYGEAIEALAHGAEGEPVLRTFELRLLQEIGYALTLDHDAATGAAVEPERWYRYEPERGPVPVNVAEPPADPRYVQGRVLHALAGEAYPDAQTAQAAKLLMRLLIDHRLDRQPLHSRTLFRELQAL